eukprot:8471005-Pyramimonas_sp.AAC.1
MVSRTRARQPYSGHVPRAAQNHTSCAIGLAQNAGFPSIKNSWGILGKRLLHAHDSFTVARHS